MTKSNFKIHTPETQPAKVKVSRTFAPSKISFNFTYVSDDRKYGLKVHRDKAVINTLITKMVTLSQKDLTELLATDSKEQGLELLPEEIVHFRVHPDFKTTGRYDACRDNYFVFRLSSHGRVIGKIFEHTFYILCVDSSFDTYKHS